ncbi:alpha/beta fold hydrolase [Streptomyces sp. CAU 1734]|uniref:thioesterase II family protein n=1 Tax=Streptomyces sp. CAU 1734 TaxID=3140360 RepID=UPI003260A806
MGDPARPVRQDSPWLRRYEPRPGAGARIICFGPAGASPGFFRGWSGLAPADVDVQILAYPGRERRALEPPLEEMAALTEAVHDVLAPRIDRPTVLFGHSMGASVAFETARLLEASGARPLAGLVVSGRPGPRVLRELPPAVTGFDDERTVAYVRSLGGTPPELLDDPEAREVILPAFRSDFRLTGRYTPELTPRVRAPLTVLCGDRDTRVSTEGAQCWNEVADHFTGVERLSGGHFYLVEEARAVVEAVMRPFAPPRPLAPAADRAV